MKRYLILTWLLCFFSVVGCGDEGGKKSYNFNFEKHSDPANLPDGWVSRYRNPLYSISLDRNETHLGQRVLKIESRDGVDADEYEGVSYTLPGNYAGKQISVKAFIRTQGLSQPIGLLLRVDGAEGMLQYDNMKQRGLTGGGDWKEYEVAMPLPAEAKRIFIGPILSGAGKLWISGIRVLLDDVDIQAAKLKELEYKADGDVEFEQGSGITIEKPTDKMVADLALLGKVWGFLKYYHPAVGKGDYNWDAELFRMMPLILKAKNTNERNEQLLSWINKLGEVESAGDSEVAGADSIKLKPDFSWMNEAALGDNLAKKLKMIVTARRGSENYYLSSSRGFPTFRNEQSYEDINYDDAGLRLLAAYRYWNMVEYFFPYRYLADKDWGGILEEFIPHFVNAKDELEYKTVIMKMVARICDTHAYVYDRTLNKIRGNKYAPYDIRFVEGKAVVAELLNPRLTGDKALANGDVIERINGQAVADIIAQKVSCISASNQSALMRDICHELLCTNGTKVAVDYLRNGKRATAELNCYTIQEMWEGRQEKEPYRLVGPDIGYIYVGSIKSEMVPQLMELFKNTKGIVLDLREYPAESIIDSFGKYIMSEPTEYVKFAATSVERPGVFIVGSPGYSVGTSRKDFYKGKVIVLVDAGTQSHGEFTAMAMRVGPQVCVVGSQTAGADGDVSKIILPGGVETAFSGIGVYYPDGRETQRVGIVPDVVVEPTIKGLREGRDELLEKAIEIIRAGDGKKDP